MFSYKYHKYGIVINFIRFIFAYMPNGPICKWPISLITQSLILLEKMYAVIVFKKLYDIKTLSGLMTKNSQSLSVDSVYFEVNFCCCRYKW